MKKTFLQIGTFLLMLVMLSAFVISCADDDIDSDAPDSGDSTADSESNGGEDNGDTAPDERGPVPNIPLGEKSVEITADELLKKIREGSLKSTDDYAVTEGEPVVFGSTDRNKSYDLNGAVIRLAVRSGESGLDLKSARGVTLKNFKLYTYGDTGIGASKARDCTLSGITVVGECQTGISVGGVNNTVDSCTVGADNVALSIENGIVAEGEGIVIKNCTLKNISNGITDSSKDGAVTEGNTLTGCQTAILTNASDSVIQHNSITGGKVGIKASFKKSEISAAMSDGYNVMAARNTVTGATVSVSFENVSNGVILLNKADSIAADGCTNIYVAENEVKEKLTLTGNSYLIANGNTYDTLKLTGNTNVNGDNVTDINSRSEAGASKELLPHINSEQFVGMKRKNSVRSTLGENNLKEYITAQIKAGKKEIIIPPGAYSFTGVELEGLSNVTIYGYGVLAEMGVSKTSHAFSFTNCTDCDVNGVFIGVSVYAHTQGTVVKRTTNSGTVTVEFVADPGYRKNFNDTSYFGDTANGFYYTEGRSYPECDFTYTSKSYDAETGSNKLVGVSQTGIKAGDRVAMRSNYSANGIAFYTCSGMVAEDVTVFSVSHFAEYDSDNNVAPVLHRFAVAGGPAPTLTGTEADYAGFESMLWRDSYGRLRSAEPMLTSCDATHSVNERTGIQIVSSLFERLADDAGNINATYGLATEFDSATRTLTYKACDVKGYNKLPGSFKAGDKIAVYSYKGELLYYGSVESASTAKANGTYSVKLDGVFTMPSEGNVVVQNISVSGWGFLIDNVCVRDVGCNGFRVKAPKGTVKNSTFERVSKGGLNCVPEYTLWPECGFIAEGLSIQNNVFDEVGYTSRNRSLANGDTVAETVWCSPILIRSELLADKSTDPDYQSDNKYLMHKNIVISGNVFKNRWSSYAICMGAVDGVEIRGNSFGECKTGAYNSLPPTLLLGGNNIKLSGNTYSTSVSAPYGTVANSKLTNVTCTDKNS